MRRLVSQATLGSFLLLTLMMVPAAAMGQPLPPVRSFVENLDVRCYRIPNQPPINVPLRLDHLNPVFVAKGLPYEDVVLREPQQLCVPVQKNAQIVPPDVLPFIEFVDWKCYGIYGPSLDLPLRLDHLNREIVRMIGPVEQVIVREPQQLCVPVAKDQKIPPPEILRLIEWLDVKCYRVDRGPIRLTHLNPLFSHLPPEAAFIEGASPLQLCVPVAKNKKYPPDEVLRHIQYSDVLCYRLRGQPLNANLRLDHLNPVLREMGLPPEYVYVTDTEKLCVPVAKDQQFPPY